MCTKKFQNCLEMLKNEDTIFGFLEISGPVTFNLYHLTRTRCKSNISGIERQDPLSRTFDLKLSRQLLTAPKPKLKISVPKVRFCGSHPFLECILLIGSGIRCFRTINVAIL